METISSILLDLEYSIDKGKLNIQISSPNENELYSHINTYLCPLIDKIKQLIEVLKKDEKLLISVKQQKVLRSCIQIVTTYGLLPWLLPGMSMNSKSIPLIKLDLTDDEKYKFIVQTIEFYTYCYEVPVLKNIIITFHLSDYLSALIQLSYAPLKKPGIYQNYTMSPEKYDALNEDRRKFVLIYENLVVNCFQPIIMKELLVLQSISNPSPPVFVKRQIAKELSRRLLAPGGLLSLIRCFIESYETDTGHEWKKLDMICKILQAKHGGLSELEYVDNMCNQVTQILITSNSHYVSIAVPCALCLIDKYGSLVPVQNMIIKIFQVFDHNQLISKSNIDGTLALSPSEVDHSINILDTCVNNAKMELPVNIIESNMYIIFKLGIQCNNNNDNMKNKITNIILKCFGKISHENIRMVLKQFLLGDENKEQGVTVVTYNSGLAIKYEKEKQPYETEHAIVFFAEIFKKCTNKHLLKVILEELINIFIEINDTRMKQKCKKLHDVVDDCDIKYAAMLQLLSEVSTLDHVVALIKAEPTVILTFIEYFLLNESNFQDESLTISIILLNTILPDSELVQERSKLFIPKLLELSKLNDSVNSILSKEALQFISGKGANKPKSECSKAIEDIYDQLLPVRAHGIIELTRLINKKDPEVLSKKHFLFCLFQEHLRDPDSYIYLAAINGISCLANYFTDDVLSVLCKEYINDISEHSDLATDVQRKTELRMKIGDIIVKVTKDLGQMAVVQKTLLLNTILCVCRDEDPLMRASALSNLAELARVINYKMGSIIYEVLLCVWSTVESDIAIECRRAAVMVISSLFKGINKETLVELKENLLPIYRHLKVIYRDVNEDSVVRLHAQLALEELNSVVTDFVFPELNLEKQIFVLDKLSL